MNVRARRHRQSTRPQLWRLRLLHSVRNARWWWWGGPSLALGWCLPSQTPWSLRLGLSALPLVIAGAHALWQQQRRRRADDLAEAALRRLPGIEWPHFLRIMAHAYRLRGWEVTPLADHYHDVPVDLELRRGHHHHLVNCRYWRTPRVGLAAVRKLHDTMQIFGCNGGWLVTSGSFTPEVQRVADLYGVRLVDGRALARVLEKVGPQVEVGPPSLPAQTQPAARAA